MLKVIFCWLVDPRNPIEITTTRPSEIRNEVPVGGKNFDEINNIAQCGRNPGIGTVGTEPSRSTTHRPFVVTNCDVITAIHYGALLDFHIVQGAAATMAVRLHEWQHPFGVVQTNGVEIVGFEEKPIARSHINAGVYGLSPDALTVLQKNSPCDMPALFERLKAQAKRTVAYPIHEPWLDAGLSEDLARAAA